MPETQVVGAAVVGMPVEVWNSYLGKWSRGFEIGEVNRDGVRLRRRSDGSLLPTVFDAELVRATPGW
ncbi:MAG TPA: hypothetical protein VFA94_13755 [Acidimicrobiales bacterium]|nr:hypothetical protein [Acidimicrobiales bacterium]